MGCKIMARKDLACVATYKLVSMEFYELKRTSVLYTGKVAQ
jgi:hypothetical protein